MSQVNRTTLKSYFETGDVPTQAQFIDFIDSVLNFVNDGNPVYSLHSGITPVSTSGTSLTNLSDTYSLLANTLSVNGQSIVIKSSGSLSGGSGARNFTVSVGGVDNTIVFSTTPGTNTYWFLKCRIVRLTSSTAVLFLSISAGGVSGGPTAGAYISISDNANAIDFTIANDIIIKGRAPSSGSVHFHQWTISKASI